MHRGRGKKSNRGYDRGVKEQVLGVYRERYRGFGPTLASEKLHAESGLRVDHETLRRWLMAEEEFYWSAFLGQGIVYVNGRYGGII